MVETGIVEQGVNPRHNRRSVPRRAKVDPLTRPFVAWDGEGMNLSGEGKPQHYVLFGSSANTFIEDKRLTCIPCLELIFETALKVPNAIHVSFAFTYDFNMIVASLSPALLAKLHKQGFIRFFGKATRYYYRLEFRRNKWFSVTRWKRGAKVREHVKIFDLFTFFACSFVKAYKDLFKDDEIIASVEEGKARRGSFDDIEYVKEYWSVEIQLLHNLAVRFRELMFTAGFTLSQWHGPGALANFTLKKQKIEAHKSLAPDPVRKAARHGYFGGRFELFHVGRWEGPIYGYDINSAYPFAISQLPSLGNAEWNHVSNPTNFARFGIYQVDFNTGGMFGMRALPFAHRDQRGLISFPPQTRGWHWSPEVSNMIKANPRNVRINEGWELVNDYERPFEWILDMYAQRKLWKSEGNSAQLALKLCMNSLYGKFAQRIGWNERARTAPKWHQLEWAGWITSHCRANIYRLARQIPHEQLIAIETDGIYTTCPPEKLGIVHGAGLGEWEVSVYDEILYVQSGIAFTRVGNKWTPKHRGLNATSISPEKLENYLSSIRPMEKWPQYEATTTRFIGLGNALATDLSRHCVWEVDFPRNMNFGYMGKRTHIPELCGACRNGKTALEMPHSLSVVTPQDIVSKEHAIPWENGLLDTELLSKDDSGEVTFN